MDPIADVLCCEALIFLIDRTVAVSSSSIRGTTTSDMRTRPQATDPSQGKEFKIVLFIEPGTFESLVARERAHRLSVALGHESLSLPRVCSRGCAGGRFGPARSLYGR